jgi:hypothetical protein
MPSLLKKERELIAHEEFQQRHSTGANIIELSEHVSSRKGTTAKKLGYGVVISGEENIHNEEEPQG